MEESSKWRIRRTFLGAAACWTVLVLGFLFMLGGLGYCGAAIEEAAERFRYNFIPLFVFISTGLVLMLGGSVGLMFLEVSARLNEIRSLVQGTTSEKKGE